MLRRWLLRILRMCSDRSKPEGSTARGMRCAFTCFHSLSLFSRQQNMLEGSLQLPCCSARLRRQRLWAAARESTQAPGVYPPEPLVRSGAPEAFAELTERRAFGAGTVTVTSRPPATNGLPEVRLHMALHCGEAIEGAVGSRHCLEPVRPGTVDRIRNFQWVFSIFYIKILLVLPVDYNFKTQFLHYGTN